MTRGPLGQVCNEAIASIWPSIPDHKPLCEFVGDNSSWSHSPLRLGRLWHVHVRFRGSKAESIVRVQIAQEFAAKVGVGVPDFTFGRRRVSFEDDRRESLMFHLAPKIACQPRMFEGQDTEHERVE